MSGSDEARREAQEEWERLVRGEGPSEQGNPLAEFVAWLTIRALLLFLLFEGFHFMLKGYFWEP